jgi:hypothetical protein
MSCKPRKRSPMRANMRTCFAMAAAIFAACLSAASASSSLACATASTPSKLDYLVLASIADSPGLLAMAGYRSGADRFQSAVN